MIMVCESIGVLLNMQEERDREVGRKRREREG
jgi:hypothetical protein